MKLPPLLCIEGVIQGRTVIPRLPLIVTTLLPMRPTYMIGEASEELIYEVKAIEAGA